MCTTAEAQFIPDGEVGTEPRHLAGNFSDLQSQLVGGGEAKHLIRLSRFNCFSFALGLIQASISLHLGYLGMFEVGVDPGEHGEDKGRGFAGSRL